MKKQLYLGIAIIIMLIAGLIYWFTYTKPSQEEIKTATVVITSVNRNLLKDKTLELLKTKDVNGNLPVKASSLPLGKSDPFQ